MQEFPKTEKQKLLAGKLSLASDPELAATVTRSIPANVVAMGNACRVMRELPVSCDPSHLLGSLSNCCIPTGEWIDRRPAAIIQNQGLKV